MLEFYPVHHGFPVLVVAKLFLPATASIGRAVCMFTLVAVIGGCATTLPGPRDETPTGPSAPPLPAHTEPPPPAVNLSGFPLTYRQGYADGCASATGPQRKDTTRFAADGNYRTGWQDGLALCQKR
jgi:hypothetical protein